MKDQFPSYASCIWSNRPDLGGVLKRLESVHNEFERDGPEGRGDSYRAAQSHQARLVGMETLLALATGAPRLWDLTYKGVILDVLGGDGLLQMASRELTGSPEGLRILTGDIAAEMVMAALMRGVPAIRQAAQEMLLEDNSVDAVVIAYGSHHIPTADRQNAIREAFRVLKPGGRLILHDFEEESPVAQWFSSIVHKYTPGGHDYAHFTRDGLRGSFEMAGFEGVKVREIYDPFRIVGGSHFEARTLMVRYVAGMYGLRLDMSDAEGSDDLVWETLQECFCYNALDLQFDIPCAQDHVTVSPVRDHFVAEVPRVALVASGVRPG